MLLRLRSKENFAQQIQWPNHFPSHPCLLLKNLVQYFLNFISHDYSIFMYVVSWPLWHQMYVQVFTTAKTRSVASLR